MLHPIQELTIPPLLKLLWIREIRGIDNIPKDGRFVAAPNHQSFFDDWVVPSIIVLHLDKELHMYVNSSYFKSPLFRWYLNHHKSIPVEVHKTRDRKKVNEKAFRKALYYLNKDEPVCIYPEGHRSPDGELQKGRVGAARLAIAAKAPVLPIGIIGSRDVLPKGKRFPKLKRVIKIRIGKPIYLKRYYGREDNKKVLNEATKLIMQGIAGLVNKEYPYC
ncbi:1-acyl-sn-glycerol-3-phosphate acyltransferase [Candidatus Woesearchaeota archaeon]|nr:1-acyl-sn-glycerol-3-phosphate acyltransferase [Candidatus Woesearchaeota archaeon]